MAELPVIPLRDLALFPGTVTPLLLGRPQSLAALNRAAESPDQSAFFTLQNHPGEEDVTPASLKTVGVVGRILNSTTLPNGLCKALVEALASGEAREWVENGSALNARVELRPTGDENAPGLAGGMALLENAFAEYVNQHMEMPRGVLDLIHALPGPLEKIYGIAGHLKLPVHLRQTLLETPDLAGKLQLTQDCLRNENEAAAASRRMEHEVRATIAQNQKEFFFTEQMRKLQLELGTTPPAINQEIRKLEEELRRKGLPEKAMERALGELRRLDYLHPSSPEYSVVRTYVDWFLALPWNRFTPDRLDLAKVKAQLDADHFGLKDVKDRILEHVAVFKLARHPTTPILCLAGPPGVGKTSLGRSVAKSLGREFIRLSLGGVRDEAEIRGHRRTYIGSMPGRLVQALKKCQSMNPVILLDEIDKMGNDFRGDPASALLEVLDAEQNHEFIDHFMEVGIDLSRVFFVTTVNVEEKIPPALHDRLEVIRLSGYYDSEKLEIGKRYLLPKVRTATGLSEAQFKLSDALLVSLIRRYTREAGVRQLSRQLSRLARKRALRVVSHKQLPPLAEKDLQDYLGLPTRQERLVPDAMDPA